VTATIRIVSLGLKIGTRDRSREGGPEQHREQPAWRPTRPVAGWRGRRGGGRRAAFCQRRRCARMCCARCPWCAHAPYMRCNSQRQGLRQRWIFDRIVIPEEYPTFGGQHRRLAVAEEMLGRRISFGTRVRDQRSATGCHLLTGKIRSRSIAIPKSGIWTEIGPGMFRRNSRSIPAASAPRTCLKIHCCYTSTG
jgi:hypothetical protein